MTEGQFQLTIASLAIFLVLFIWMTMRLRKTDSSAGNPENSNEAAGHVDRNEIIQKVARMDEVTSKETYMRVYNITEDELAAFEKKKNNAGK